VMHALKQQAEAAAEAPAHEDKGKKAVPAKAKKAS